MFAQKVILFLSLLAPALGVDLSYANCKACYRRDQKKLTWITHGNPNSEDFWARAYAGVQMAEKHLNVTVDLQYVVDTSPESQAALIRKSFRYDAVASTVYDATILPAAVANLSAMGVPTYAFNSGDAVALQVGAQMYFGQVEYIGGLFSGRKFGRMGKRNALCPYFVYNSASLIARCQGLRDGLAEFGGRILSEFYVERTNSDNVASEIQMKVNAHPTVDCILVLNSALVAPMQVGLANAGITTMTMGTFDLDMATLEKVRGGQLTFAIDQQEFLQGYLPIIAMMLKTTNGQAVLNSNVYTGPAIVDSTNVEKVMCSLDSSLSFCVAAKSVSQLVLAYVVHGRPVDPFWAQALHGATQAAKDLGIKLNVTYPPIFDLTQNKTLMTNAALSSDGMVVSLPNRVRTLDPITTAMGRNIPIVSLGAGYTVSQNLSIPMHVGQDEYEAGLKLGRTFGQKGVTLAACFLHEFGNTDLETRCKGFQDGLAETGGNVTVENGRNYISVSIDDAFSIQVEAYRVHQTYPTLNGFAFLTSKTGEVIAKTLVTANVDLSSRVIGGYGWSADIAADINAGNIDFVLHEQPFLQGYMSVYTVGLFLITNRFRPQNPILNTGPILINATNIAKYYCDTDVTRNPGAICSKQNIKR